MLSKKWSEKRAKQREGAHARERMREWESEEENI